MPKREPHIVKMSNAELLTESKLSGYTKAGRKKLTDEIAFRKKWNLMRKDAGKKK